MADLLWQQDDSDNMVYHYARLASAAKDDHIAAMHEWWEKLVNLAGAVDDWNVVAADIWVDTGRIIGHVQNSDVAVGYDRGFRVALTIESAVEELNEADFEEDVYLAVSVHLSDLLDESSGQEPSRARLVELNKKNPFELWWCNHGELVEPLDAPE